MVIQEAGNMSGSQFRESTGQIPSVITKPESRLAQGRRSLRSFIGCVVVIPLLAIAAKANVITNGSFETVSPSIPANGICTTNQAIYPSVDPGAYPACAATGWTGNYQIANGNSVGVFGVSFGIPQPYPDGSNALILQAELNVAPTATESIDFTTAGLYTLSFFAANRSTPTVDDGPQTIFALLDNSLITGGTFANLPAGWTLETVTFDATAGIHSLTLEGLDETSGLPADNVSAFVDAVSLTPQNATVPEPSSIELSGLGVIGLILLVNRRRTA